MARQFVLEAKAPDIVLLGSSQVNSPAWAADATLLQHSVDCLLHRKVVSLSKFLARRKGLPGNLLVANCAVQGGVASDYYMIAHALLLGESKPTAAVVAISPRDFIDNKLPSASATEAFHFFSPFVEINKLSEIAYSDPLARLLAGVEWSLEALPLRRIGTMIDERFSNATETRLRGGPRNESGNELLSAIYNSHKQVKVGEWVVSPNMKPVFVDNTNEYVVRYKDPHPKSLPVQYAFFRELLKNLQESNISTIVVNMPTLPCNHNLLDASFWTAYRRDISRMCAETGSHWVDLSESNDFTRSDYVDTVHLNDKGGLKLFHKLAKVIASDQQLIATLRSKQQLAGSAVTK